jgi:Trk K+ transport system NAD-binding subunit
MAVGSTNGSHAGVAKVMAAAGLLAGGLALGLVTSFMSAQQIQRRVVERMRRHAARMSGHVIVVGTDDVGLRIAALLRHLTIGCVIVEPNRERQRDLGTLDGSTALQEVGEYTPILTGPLSATLEQARIDRARAVIASSEDNLINVEACMRARRRRGRNQIRTVARVFDDGATSDIADALGIDQWVAAVEAAAPAFVDAAVEGRSGRTIDAAGVDLYGALWSGRPVHAAKMLRWRAAGIRVLAVSSEGALRPLTTPPTYLRRDDQAILVGPRAAVLRAIGHDDTPPAEVWDIFGGRASGSAQ